MWHFHLWPEVIAVTTFALISPAMILYDFVTDQILEWHRRKAGTPWVECRHPPTYDPEEVQARPAAQPVYEPPPPPPSPSPSLSETAPRFAAMAMWLEGYGVPDISDELQCTEEAVLTALCLDGYVLNHRPWDEP